MQPSSYNQPQPGGVPNAAGAQDFGNGAVQLQPGISAVPQHIPAFDAPLQSSPPPQQPSPQSAYAQSVTQQFQQAAVPQTAAFSGPTPAPVATVMPQQPVIPQAAPPAPQAATVVAGGGAPQQKVTPVQPRTNPNSTQNTLQIAEVRDGIIIMSDGSFRSIVMVKSINFDLMSPQEQEAVEFSYQGFLNSLYFPIQIFIRSQKVDLQPYIDKLDKIRSEHDNMLLALLMEDYISYIDQLGQQTNIMDKKFYIVIPFFPHVDVQKALTQSKNFFSGVTALFSNKQQHVTINEEELEKAKTELRNRVQSVLSGLVQCGVQGLPLDTQELIELLYDTYNPDTATRQQLKNFSGNLDADIITKGEGKAVQPHMQREMN
jgi:hypothetical protein